MISEKSLQRSSIAVIAFFCTTQLAGAGPATTTNDADEQVILIDGSVMAKSELHPGDIVLGGVHPFTSSDSGTMTVGGTVTLCGGSSARIQDGFSPTFGSYVPTALTGGGTVAALEESFPIIPCTGVTLSFLEVTGFSSNPGSSWLTSVTCNGITKTGATASFAYSAGAAGWTWGSLFGFPAKGSTASCTIVHN